MREYYTNNYKVNQRIAILEDTNRKPTIKPKIPDPLE